MERRETTSVKYSALKDGVSQRCLMTIMNAGATGMDGERHIDILPPAKAGGSMSKRAGTCDTSSDGSLKVISRPYCSGVS
jgi:hypothetical protein